MNSRANDDFVPAIFMIVVILCGIGVWKFSQATGLPWDSSLKVIIGMTITTAFAGTYAYFTRYGYNSFSIWPLFVLGIYISWFPAFDYWGINTDTYYDIFKDDGFHEVTELAWYARWYTKVLVSLLILWCGYFGLPKLKEML